MKKLLLGFVALGVVVLGFAFGCAGQVPEVSPEQFSVPEVNYPAEAKGTGLEGVVTVGVDLDEAGKVVKVTSVSGPDAVCRGYSRPDVNAMRAEAVKAAEKATFSPAQMGGQPVAWHSVVRVTFTNPDADHTREVAAGPLDGRPMVGTATIMGSTGASAASGEGVHILKGTSSTHTMVSGGVLNGKATSLPKPMYPPAARAVNAGGAVTVQVIVDENGKVYKASVVSGHPLLRAASITAACDSEFSPVLLSGQPVKISGVITYNFVP